MSSTDSHGHYTAAVGSVVLVTDCAFSYSFYWSYLGNDAG